jgi:hypothetical protein
LNLRPHKRESSANLILGFDLEHFEKEIYEMIPVSTRGPRQSLHQFERNRRRKPTETGIAGGDLLLLFD